MIKARIARWLEDAWYREMYVSAMIMPLSMLYIDVIRLRRWLYKMGLMHSTRLPVPVIIVGNLTVGGTGKTPLVVWLVEFLRKHGYQPGVISRGYAGKTEPTPQIVTVDSNPALVGDEALLLAQHCDCPVVVNSDRPAAALHLLANFPCNVIIADDGLQHYALQRDIEIAVIDGQRRFGNGYCLPAGPLREPQTRLKEVDLIVTNGGTAELDGEFLMHCRGDALINLFSGEHKLLAELSGQACRAIAGIGNPQRFFSQLASAGLSCETIAFPDHHAFVAADLKFKDGKPLIMTEKDAVKCRAFAQPNHWYLPISAELPERFSQQLLQLLKDKNHG
jgi:tetraacyldisaccharide 4'-kinase